MVDGSGVALCARFSLVTNRLGYCGPGDAGSVLYRAIVRGESSEEAGRALLKFEALAPYLELIAAKHGLEPLDHRVVEAYWIGNTLLDAFDRDDFDGLIVRLTQQGLPRSVADRLRRHLPQRPIPHHAFHVAFVGVGAVTGHVPTTLENVERCRPSWAEVVAIAPTAVRLVHPTLGVRGGALVWGPTHEVETAWDPQLLPGLVVGDAVAVHWGTPVLRLGGEGRERLEYYTRRSLESANEALPALGVFADGRPAS